MFIFHTVSSNQMLELLNGREIAGIFASICSAEFRQLEEKLIEVLLFCPAVRLKFLVLQACWSLNSKQDLISKLERCYWWIILGDLSMNKDISSDGSGHLSGCSRFQGFCYSGKVFLLPRWFAAGLSLRTWFGYFCISVVTFVSLVTHLPHFNSRYHSIISKSQSPCLCVTNSLHLLSFSAPVVTLFHIQSCVRPSEKPPAWSHSLLFFDLWYP